MRWSSVLLWRGWALLVLCAFAVVVDTQGWNGWYGLIPLLGLPAVHAYIHQPEGEPPAEASHFYRLAPIFFVGILVMQWLTERPLNPAYAMGMTSFTAGIGLMMTALRLRVRGQ